MKNVSKVSLLVLAVALSVVAAQTHSTTNMGGVIPFDFVAGSQTFTAGQYTVKTITPDPEIEAWNGPDGRTFILRTIPLGTPGEGTKLVFHRYGDQYFLAEIWNRGESHQIASSGEQRIAAKDKFVPVAVLMNFRR